MTSIDEDFQAWCVEQATLLREGRFDAIDLPNIIEELESLDRAEKSKLRDELERGIHTLLLWRTFEGRRATGWYVTITDARAMIKAVLESSPQLHRQLPHLFAAAYGDARRWVAWNTGLDIRLLSKEPPFDYEYLMTMNLDEMERTPPHDD